MPAQGGTLEVFLGSSLSPELIYLVGYALTNYSDMKK